MTDTISPADTTDEPDQHRAGGGRSRPLVVALDDDRATDAELVGGKAAALARASANGLPALSGAVLTTAACERIDADEAIGELDVFDDLLAVGSRLVARSSSVVEDMDESSAAGQFETVLDIDSADDMAAAIRTVLDSRQRAGAEDHPIAVLVQPFIDPDVGGVLFGIDPVTGRKDRIVVTAIAGQPDPLVSGEVDGSHHLLDRDGELLESEERDGVILDDDVLRALARLARDTADAFDGPQDVEWARMDGELVLLQSRPVTTEIRGTPHGGVYGPGPVAETFPERLRTLEADLWIPPLRDGVREALRLAAAVPESDLDDDEDLVIEVDGWAAIDLERTGEIDRREDRPPWFAVTKRIRRLRSAWRVGRLRASLPALADNLIDKVDADLEELPDLASLTDRQLVALLGRGRLALRSLHAHEVLMGLLTETDDRDLTAASVAMRVLAEARTDGRSDDEIVAASPVVLALTPPKISLHSELPPPSTTPELLPGREPSGDADTGRTDGSSPAGVAREALRLRARWVQELTGRAAWTLGERLTDAGRLPGADLVPHLTYEELTELVTHRVVVAEDLLDDRRSRFEDTEAEPLPARFRLSDAGEPVPERADNESGGGTGAGGGTVTGVVTHDTDDPPADSILVVRTLAPGIGPLLSRIGGVVSETGSVLAHLAILAREAGVPVVVGHAGATDEFAEGDTITVDGTSGRVSHDDQEATS